MESREEEDLFSTNSADENINGREINIVVSWVDNKVSINSANCLYLEYKANEGQKITVVKMLLKTNLF